MMNCAAFFVTYFVMSFSEVGENYLTKLFFAYNCLHFSSYFPLNKFTAR
jgi:hypothetical protein